MNDQNYAKGAFNLSKDWEDILDTADGLSEFIASLLDVFEEKLPDIKEAVSSFLDDLESFDFSSIADAFDLDQINIDGIDLSFLSNPIDFGDLDSLGIGDVLERVKNSVPDIDIPGVDIDDIIAQVKTWAEALENDSFSVAIKKEAITTDTNSTITTVDTSAVDANLDTQNTIANASETSASGTTADADPVDWTEAIQAVLPDAVTDLITEMENLSAKFEAITGSDDDESSPASKIISAVQNNETISSFVSANVEANSGDSAAGVNTSPTLKEVLKELPELMKTVTAQFSGKKQKFEEILDQLEVILQQAKSIDFSLPTDADITDLYNLITLNRYETPRLPSVLCLPIAIPLTLGYKKITGEKPVFASFTSDSDTEVLPIVTKGGAGLFNNIAIFFDVLTYKGDKQKRVRSETGSVSASTIGSLFEIVESSYGIHKEGHSAREWFQIIFAVINILDIINSVYVASRFDKLIGTRHNFLRRYKNRAKFSFPPLWGIFSFTSIIIAAAVPLSRSDPNFGRKLLLVFMGNLSMGLGAIFDIWIYRNTLRLNSEKVKINNLGADTIVTLEFTHPLKSEFFPVPPVPPVAMDDYFKITKMNGNFYTITEATLDNNNRKVKLEIAGRIASQDANNCRVTLGDRIQDNFGNIHDGYTVVAAGKHELSPILKPENIVVVNNDSNKHTITLTFDQALEAASLSENGIPNFKVTNNNGSITYDLVGAAFVNADPKEVVLTLKDVDPADNKTYITNADAKAGLKVTPKDTVQDNDGNFYQNKEITASGGGPNHTLDTTSPTLSPANIKVNNDTDQLNTITLIFGKPLNENSAKEHANYQVTNGLAAPNTIIYDIASATLATANANAYKEVTLTLKSVELGKPSTYIKTIDATNIKVTPQVGLTDYLGNTYQQNATVTAIAQPQPPHQLDTTSPTLARANIKVNNNTDQSNTITLIFGKALDQMTAENPANYVITNNADTITYAIASATLETNNANADAYKKVTLTLEDVALNNPSTYIKTIDATNIKVTPQVGLTDYLGNTYQQNATVTAIEQPQPSHQLDATSPTLARANIKVNNNTDQPNTITLIFGKALDQITAETPANYVVTNNAGTITYGIASAMLETNNANADAYKKVILTLEDVALNNPFTYIKTIDATNIKVTPQVGLTDYLGNTYQQNATVTAIEGPQHNLTAIPTAAITYLQVEPYQNGTEIVITATFSKPMAEDPIPLIAFPGNLLVVAPTRNNATQYTYRFTFPDGSGNKMITVSLSQGTDLAGNVVVAEPTSGRTFEIQDP